MKEENDTSTISDKKPKLKDYFNHTDITIEIDGMLNGAISLLPIMVKFKNEGDRLIGYYKGYETVTSSVLGGKESNLYHINLLSGQLVVFYGSKQLDDALIPLVPIGYEIDIELNGVKSLGLGRTMKIFDIVARKNTEETGNLCTSTTESNPDIEELPF